ncbi:MAG TPA: VWA domain-containing protein [Silvibacterium sp.]|nr:VWA domain-containing protein [Silvibacterium sp.]
MFTHARLTVFLLLPWLSAAVTSAPQESQASPPVNGRIHLDVVVTPKSGPPVSGLQQQDFTILDNKAPQPITSFQALGGSQAPIEVILLVDAVNNTFTSIAYERIQINNFLHANGGRLAHPTALAVLTDAGAQMQEGFSSDGNALSASLDQYTVGLRTIRRSAGFYGATERLQLSLQALSELMAREAARPGRKVVLWMSPGWPLLSGPNVQLDSKQQQQIFQNIVSLSNQLRQARITLYSIDPLGAGEPSLRTFYYEQFVKGITKPSQAVPGNLGLQVLAVQSGGLALSSGNDIAALLQQCLTDTNSYYELSFDPPRAEPYEYHHLEVRVAKPGLIARTRQGYYGQP